MRSDIGFGFGPKIGSDTPAEAEEAGNWWEAGGASGAVAVYQPKGAASYAASLTDLSGNENDASEGTAPDWDADNGWKFNGSDDYLDTGLVIASGYTIIVRFSNVADNGYLFGISETED